MIYECIHINVYQICIFIYLFNIIIWAGSLIIINKYTKFSLELFNYKTSGTEVYLIFSIKVAQHCIQYFMII